MMVQTKIFTATDSSKLEQNMNEWLEESCRYDDKVKQVKYLATQTGTITKYNVLIMYET